MEVRWLWLVIYADRNTINGLRSSMGFGVHGELVSAQVTIYSPRMMTAKGRRFRVR